jgi:hypothetical protein
MKNAASVASGLPLAFLASSLSVGSAESRYCRRLWTLQ